MAFQVQGKGCLLNAAIALGDSAVVTGRGTALHLTTGNSGAGGLSSAPDLMLSAMTL